MTGLLLRGAALGLALGAAWGVLARVWMRLISTDPEFSWSGTLIIVGLAALLGAGVGLVDAALRAGRSRWWTLAVLPGLPLLLGPGSLLAPCFLVGGLAWRPHRWWLRVLGALMLVGSIAGATRLVTTDPHAQPVTARDVVVFATGFTVLALGLAWAKLACVAAATDPRTTSGSSCGRQTGQRVFGVVAAWRPVMLIHARQREWPRALSLGLLTLLVIAACSNEPPGSDADSAPSQTAAATSADVMRAVSDNLETLETLLPGGVVVVRVGAKSHAVAFGKAETRPKRAMTSEDRFQIGSITKTMVATLVLQEVADGNLRLDDTVGDLLPGLLPDGGRITVEHLLSHRSGLFNYTDSHDLDFSRHWQPRDIVKLAAGEPMLFRPGTQGSYSNTNYIVLGLILEEVTGRSVEELLRTRIFDPAGMSATSLEQRRVAEPPIAHGYENGADVTATDLSLGWTAGGVVSTAGDLTHFMEALSHDRLGAHLLPELSTWRGELDPGGVRYGLGLAGVPISCGEAWGHNGELPGFASQAWSLPDGTRSVVILLNETGYDDLATSAIDAALCT